MSIVVDASTLVGILLPDEGGVYSEAVAKRLVEIGGTAPSLVRVEVTNALVQAERRGRVEVGSAEKFVSQLEAIKLVVNKEFRSGDTIWLARRHRLSAYDACYLELVLRLDLPLASLDRRLLTAYEAEGGAPFQPT